MVYEGYTKIAHYEEKDADEFERMIRVENWKRASHFSLVGYAMDEPVEYKKGYYCTDKYTFNLHREL